jgi:hypothetical protein
MPGPTPETPLEEHAGAVPVVLHSVELLWIIAE